VGVEVEVTVFVDVAASRVDVLVGVDGTKVFVGVGGTTV
jgi:hypothetical protein